MEKKSWVSINWNQTWEAKNEQRNGKMNEYEKERKNCI